MSEYNKTETDSKYREQTSDYRYAPVSLMGEFHGQRSLVGYSPWDSSTAPLTCFSTYLAFTASSTSSFYLSHLLNSIVPRTLSSALF